VSTIIRVRAVEEAAIEVLAEEMARAYFWRGRYPGASWDFLWSRLKPREREKWRAAARRVEEMILSGEITVVETPGR